MILVCLISYTSDDGSDSVTDDNNDGTDPIYYSMVDSATSSDDSGLGDSNTDDDSNDSITDNSNDSSNDSSDPILYYALEGNNSGPVMNGTGVRNSTGDSGITPTATVTTYGDPQNAKIPMQKTGIPILPAELGIISIIGGFMINRIRS